MTLRQAQQTLAVLEGDIGEDSELMYELKKAVKEVGTAGKAIQGLAKALERQPESLLFGKKKK
jgi:paraquat-inducible protein B